ncbi:MAG: DUF1573 domain-containing protein [Planctomycetes bacterium]|nr:DUF1573 domain-containing protein [Planctomycetota bacterium]
MRKNYETQTSQIVQRTTQIICVICGCLLLLQLGCQEQGKLAEKPTIAPETAVVGSPQKDETALAKLDKPVPKITFEKTVYDFGQIGTGAKKRVAEFKFTNTGDGLLKITKVERCCGVVTRLEKIEYAPGESGVLKVEYQSNSKAGLDRKTVYVESNDKTNPRIALTLKVRIVSKVSYSPKRLRLFLEEKNAGCPKIVLSSLDNQPFAITKFKSTGDCITADIDSSVEATKFILEPIVDMEKLNNNLKGRINISLTHPEEKAANIFFDVLPKFTISPPMIITFNAEPQKPILRKITVLNNYGGDFEIESASSKDNTIKVLSRKKIRNGYQFEVEIMPPPPAEGKTQFADVFFVKIKGGNRLGIVCRGFYSRK